MSKRRTKSSSKNNTTKDNIDRQLGKDEQEGGENLELTEEEILEQERLERKRIRQQRRDDMRNEILGTLNVNQNENLGAGQVSFEVPDCPWRANVISPLQQYVDREEESHEAKLKRNKIPPKKINEMCARWILTLVSIHTHHKNTNESLASVVYKERVKASKGMRLWQIIISLVA